MRSYMQNVLQRLDACIPWYQACSVTSLITGVTSSVPSVSSPGGPTYAYAGVTSGRGLQLLTALLSDSVDAVNRKADEWQQDADRSVACVGMEDWDPCRLLHDLQQTHLKC